MGRRKRWWADTLCGMSCTQDLAVETSFGPKIQKNQKKIRKYIEKLPINRPSGYYVMDKTCAASPNPHLDPTRTKNIESIKK